MTKRPPADGTRAFAGTLSTLVVLALFAAYAQVPPRWAPSWLVERRDNFVAIWPQRWPFFSTGDGLGAVVAYRIVDDGPPAPVDEALTSSTNLWGLSRARYAQAVEIDAAQRRLGGADWYPCDAASIGDCTAVLAAAASAVVDGLPAGGGLCGRFVLAREVAAAAGTPGTGRRITAVAPVELRCWG